MHPLFQQLMQLGNPEFGKPQPPMQGLGPHLPMGPQMPMRRPMQYGGNPYQMGMGGMRSTM